MNTSVTLVVNNAGCAEMMLGNETEEGLVPEGEVLAHIEQVESPELAALGFIIAGNESLRNALDDLLTRAFNVGRESVGASS